MNKKILYIFIRSNLGDYYFIKNNGQPIKPVENVLDCNSFRPIGATQPLEVIPFGLIVLELEMVQLMIQPFMHQQLLMRAGFHNLPLIQNQNPIGMLDRRESVGNHKSDCPFNRFCIQIFFLASIN
jgi:hypothetical protein